MVFPILIIGLISILYFSAIIPPIIYLFKGLNKEEKTKDIIFEYFIVSLIAVLSIIVGIELIHLLIILL